MNKGLAAGATVVAVSVPIATTVATAPPAAADQVVNSGTYSAVWEPSPTWTVTWEWCDVAPSPFCAFASAPWLMYDSSDWKGMSSQNNGVVDYLLSFRDHFNLQIVNGRASALDIYQPFGEALDERFDQNGWERNTYPAVGDTCLTPGANWALCEMTGTPAPDQRQFRSWVFFGVGAIGSHDGSVTMWDQFIANYRFK